MKSRAASKAAGTQGVEKPPSMVNKTSLDGCNSGWIHPAMLQTVPGHVLQQLKTKEEPHPGLAAIWVEYRLIPLRLSWVAVRERNRA